MGMIIYKPVVPYYIYKATNLKNGMCYIGQTSQELEDRKRQHEESNSKKGRPFQRALYEYGKSNFKWEIIDEVYEDWLVDAQEAYWIQYYKSNDTKRGYNIESGGKVGKTVNKEGKQNISKGMYKSSIYNGRYIINLTTKEIFLTIKEASDWYGIPHSQINNVVLGVMARTGGYEFMFLEEYIVDEKLYQETWDARKPRDTSSKTVIDFTNNIEYSSPSEAEKINKITRGSVSKCCRCKHRTTKGIVWGYKKRYLTDKIYKKYIQDSIKMQK